MAETTCTKIESGITYWDVTGDNRPEKFFVRDSLVGCTRYGECSRFPDIYVRVEDGGQCHDIRLDSGYMNGGVDFLAVGVRDYHQDPHQLIYQLRPPSDFHSDQCREVRFMSLQQVREKIAAALKPTPAP